MQVPKGVLVSALLVGGVCAAAWQVVVLPLKDKSTREGASAIGGFNRSGG